MQKRIACFVSVFLFTTFLFLNSCQKNARLISEDKIDLSESASSSSLTALVVVPTCTGLKDVMPAVNQDNDSIERPTVLGVKHVNPYLIPNMQKAYANLGITSQAITVNNLYVRFLPNSAQQLGTLDSIMDVQGLDLFDTPMDYDVTEGDYYQDPTIPMEQVTWQYAVVPPNFVAPAGITYQVLAQIHIPGDNYTAVETEAERLAAVQDCAVGAAAAATPTCPRCQVWSTAQNKCVPYTCPTGYVCDDGGNGGCILQPPPPVDPPAPAPDAAIPAGNITVNDLNFAGTPNATPGVRGLRVIVKRWFKIQRLYTDNNGHFTATKRFKHNVKVIVKFKNDDATIKTIRASKLWQMQLPISKKIGIYGSDKSTIAYNFATSGTSFNKTNRNWAAATIYNSVLEHKEYAVQLGFSFPPSGIRICIRYSGTGNSGATPMFGKRAFTAIPMSWITTFAYNSYENPSGGYTAALAVISAINLDMLIEYNLSHYSDGLKETVYHELSHATHYTKAGVQWYTNFVNSEMAELQGNQPTGQYTPYGHGNTSNSAVIALGEGWAYFMGHFLADRRYGSKSSQAVEQKLAYDNGSPVTGLSSHLNLLEDFNPARTDDPFRWIPQGLFYDLYDNRNDFTATTSPRVFLDDQVSGYTIGQMFNAFNSGITTLQGYRANLLNLNSNNQATGINTMFSFYGY